MDDFPDEDNLELVLAAFSEFEVELSAEDRQQLITIEAAITELLQEEFRQEFLDSCKRLEATGTVSELRMRAKQSGSSILRVLLQPCKIRAGTEAVKEARAELLAALHLLLLAMTSKLSFPTSIIEKLSDRLPLQPA